LHRQALLVLAEPVPNSSRVGSVVLVQEGLGRNDEAGVQKPHCAAPWAMIALLNRVQSAGLADALHG